MRRSYRRMFVSGSWLVAMLTSLGCSHMNNTEAGTLGGGAIGTAAGLAIGAMTGNPKTGAIVGGLAGAGIGGLAGKAADNEEAAAIRQAELTQPATVPPPPLGLTDVVALAQSGASDQVIVSQIRATRSTFQLSTSDIQFLKANAVSDGVISEMINSRGKPVALHRTRPTMIIEEPPPVVIYRRPWGPWGCYGPPVGPAFGFNYVHIRR